MSLRIVHKEFFPRGNLTAWKTIAHIAHNILHSSLSEVLVTLQQQRRVPETHRGWARTRARGQLALVHAHTCLTWAGQTLLLVGASDWHTCQLRPRCFLLFFCGWLLRRVGRCCRTSRLRATLGVRPRKATMAPWEALKPRPARWTSPVRTGLVRPDTI